MKTFITLGIIAVVFGGFVCSTRNDLVSSDQIVQQSLGDLDAAYQRRADLIPNLVKTVQAAGQFEKGTFVEIAEARAKAGQIHVTADDLKDPAKLAAFESAQTALQSSLTKLLAVAESYPALHATEAYRDLMTQLEGTENRIQTERHKVNEVIGLYNRDVLSFPGSLVASSYGYKPRLMFAAQAGADRAPVVDFGGGK